MAAPSRRVAKAVKWGSVPVALGLSALLVWQASYAAFSDTITNPGNNWTTGTVQLDSTGIGTATFVADNLRPGSTGTRCVVVSSTGTLPSLVKLYGTNPKGAGLAASLKLQVTPGTGGDAACADFNADTTVTAYDGTLVGLAANYADGAVPWTTAGTNSATTPAAESRTYKFTYTVDPAANNDVQGKTAGIDFVWEARNT